jgi:hypothetical protein
LYTEGVGERGRHTREEIPMSTAMDATTLSDMLAHPSWLVRVTAAESPYATEELLMAALADEHPYVREAAADSPNATEEVLMAALGDKLP